MLTTRVTTSATPLYRVALPSQVQTMPFWKLTSSPQLLASVCRVPAVNGLSRSSWRAVFVGASSSHTIGRAKKTRKKATTTMARARPSQRPGLRRAGAVRGGAALSSIALKETSAEDEEGGEADGYDQQQQRDRRRAVEVALPEGELVRQLVQR